MIKEGDRDAVYSYYALHQLHWSPSYFMSLDENERAFVMACIDIKVEQLKR